MNWSLKNQLYIFFAGLQTLLLVDYMGIWVRDSRTIGSSDWAEWLTFLSWKLYNKTFKNGVLFEEFLRFLFVFDFCLHLVYSYSTCLDVWWRLRRTKKERKHTGVRRRRGVASSDAKCIEGPSINCTECTNLMLYSGLHAKSLKFVWAWRYTLPSKNLLCPMQCCLAGTVVCILVRTASFPRFWRNHP